MPLPLNPCRVDSEHGEICEALKKGAVQEKSSPKMGKCPRMGKPTRKDIFAEVGVDAEAVSRIFLLLGDFFQKWKKQAGRFWSKMSETEVS